MIRGLHDVRKAAKLIVRLSEGDCELCGEPIGDSTILRLRGARDVESGLRLGNGPNNAPLVFLQPWRLWAKIYPLKRLHVHLFVLPH